MSQYEKGQRSNWLRLPSGQWQILGGIPERALVHEPGGRGDKMRGMAQRLQ